MDATEPLSLLRVIPDLPRQHWHHLAGDIDSRNNKRGGRGPVGDRYYVCLPLGRGGSSLRILARLLGLVPLCLGVLFVQELQAALQREPLRLLLTRALGAVSANLPSALIVSVDLPLARKLAFL